MSGIEKFLMMCITCLLRSLLLRRKKIISRIKLLMQSKILQHLKMKSNEKESQNIGSEKLNRKYFQVCIK